VTGWLLTGGAGYIGSHVARSLLRAGERVVVLDDLSTGESARVPAEVPLVVADVGDEKRVRAALQDHEITGVIHLAAKKAVEESVADPVHYYRQNVSGLVGLLAAMAADGVDRLVFSSSAAVYGTTTSATVDERSPTLPDSPYGRTKLIGEWLVRDVVRARGLRAVNLRYFNVVGCAEPTLADPGGANLFPIVLRRMAAQAPVTVFGGDYDTPDGTCVRDYIHVQDLADAHVAATTLAARPACDEVVNIGTGRGYTVLEVLDEFARVAGRPVPRLIVGRRAGDPPAMIADASKAARMLGWRPRFDLADMVGSTWHAAGFTVGHRPGTEPGQW